MTPKEQAHKLIIRFYYLLPNNGSRIGLLSTEKRWIEGIKCAIMSVTIMLEEYNSTLDKNIERTQYWEEVKYELKNYLDESERKSK